MARVCPTALMIDSTVLTLNGYPWDAIVLTRDLTAKILNTMQGSEIFVSRGSMANLI